MPWRPRRDGRQRSRVSIGFLAVPDGLLCPAWPEDGSKEVRSLASSPSQCKPGCYPGPDIEREAAGSSDTLVPIAAVIEESPAWEAGFEGGCFLTALDGRPIPDIIDWRWRSTGSSIEVGYIDLDGEAGAVTLQRSDGEDWGFVFEGTVFDGIRRCRNACTFCFMHQLPSGLRPSLYLRDDDFRLSFLAGTFVTLTNLTAADERRIIEQRLSPLHVSLQAADPAVRRRLIGRHADRGLAALERLLDAGIRCAVQVVLVPGANDGAVLEDTLRWAEEHPGIDSVGIVPLGYTRHQDRFHRSFNDAADARAVLDAIAPFQQRALDRRGTPWVFAADEFYSNAYGDGLLEYLPDAAFYGDFALFEDGIGIIRTVVDDWRSPEVRECARRTAEALRRAGRRAWMVSGLAQRHFLDRLLAEAGLDGLMRPLYVDNGFFGGNVDVTGLLCGADMAPAIAAERAADSRALFFVPSIVFNDDGLTLDGWSADDLQQAAGCPVTVVSLSPTEYLAQIAAQAAVSE